MRYRNDTPPEALIVLPREIQHAFIRLQPALPTDGKAT